MPRIKTDLLQEGMMVATDVTNIDNMLLIPAGCTLTERKIRILQTWGVVEIEVQDCKGTEAANPLANLTPEEAARMAAEVKSLFWQPDDSDPVFEQIFKLMLHRRVRTTAVKHP